MLCVAFYFFHIIESRRNRAFSHPFWSTSWIKLQMADVILAFRLDASREYVRQTFFLTTPTWGRLESWDLMTEVATKWKQLFQSSNWVLKCLTAVVLDFHSVLLLHPAKK